MVALFTLSAAALSVRARTGTSEKVQGEPVSSGTDKRESGPGRPCRESAPPLGFQGGAVLLQGWNEKTAFEVDFGMIRICCSFPKPVGAYCVRRIVEKKRCEIA